ncbi:MAG: hypothetical protein HY901_09010 [Deltaproteobacteria bacterium]|nr:hypothetical protein [Deltaproteobacteria bacterium]
MTIREGKWDCPQCGLKGNRGSEQKCRQCNKVRGDEVRFYLEDEAAEVLDEAQLAKAQAGADWVCQFCEAINPAGGKQCRSCGAERTEKQREVKEILDQPVSPPLPPPKKKGLGRPAGIVGMLALLLGGGGWLLCAPSERAMSLARVSWERTIEVERYDTVVKEAWRDEVPGGGRVQSATQKVHHVNKVQTGTRAVSKQVEEKVQTGTRTVKVGKKDLGNGYFEDITKEEPVYERRTRTVTEDEPVYRDDPVYKDWCKYEIEEWHRDRTERASAADATPHWPQTRLSGGKEREGKRSEAYLAVFKDEKGKEWEWKPPFDSWKGLAVGQTYKLDVSRLGGIQGLAK